jgi:hypothetical protein
VPALALLEQRPHRLDRTASTAPPRPHRLDRDVQRLRHTDVAVDEQPVRVAVLIPRGRVITGTA